jgi:hypothetical protein
MFLAKFVQEITETAKFNTSDVWNNDPRSLITFSSDEYEATIFQAGTIRYL